ncbi:myb-related transcription factor, partner of profilin-like [Hyla sarda]|uniref:myb-related transcription factor, partner of profilin-like n=1 Tax=Hyla sarda TaxID=327740 RepID=UPI0024C29D45|nr:myb-related transcription factor, partner of profilin-like [Hyla sarda]
MMSSGGKRTSSPAEEMFLWITSDGEGHQADSSSESALSSELQCMESSGSVVKRRCRAGKKKNYTDQEMELLVDEVIANWRTLFSKNSEKMPMSIRTAVWNGILVKVNSLGIDRRTVPELKKKWVDIRNKVKAKMALVSKESQQTSGGSRSNVYLTAMERKVASTYTRQQTQGIGNIDVCNIVQNSTLQRCESGFSDVMPAGKRPLSPAGRLHYVSKNKVLEPVSHPIAKEMPKPRVEPLHVVENLHEQVDATQQDLPIETDDIQESQDEIPGPDDLGLPLAQSSFLTSYFQQNMQFMTRVERRLEGMERSLEIIANTLVTGLAHLQRYAPSTPTSSQHVQPAVSQQTRGQESASSTQCNQCGNVTFPITAPPLSLGRSQESLSFSCPNLKEENTSVSCRMTSTLGTQPPTVYPLALSLDLFSGSGDEGNSQVNISEPRKSTSTAAAFLPQCKTEDSSEYSP